VADRYNSSLAFLVAVSWHAEEYTYADLSALALVSAFLDTGALMCLDRHENTTGFTTGLLFSTFRLCRLPHGRVNLFSPSFLRIFAACSPMEKCTREQREKSRFFGAIRGTEG